MNLDDKIFELIILEPNNFEILKQVVERICKVHGKVKIRSAMISKIVIDANDCFDENDLKSFINYCSNFNQVCKIHLQFSHDILFPAHVECSSENVRTHLFSVGFLYNYNFMLTHKFLDPPPIRNNDDSIFAQMFGRNIDIDIMKTLEALNFKNVRNPNHNANWFHDQRILRLNYPNMFDQTDFNFQFEYSSFLKVYIFQDSVNLKVTLTIGIGYPPEFFMAPKNTKFSRVYENPFGNNNNEKWEHLIKSSAFQIQLSFESSEKSRDFISHLHSTLTCPIIFLPNPMIIDTSNIFVQPSNISSSASYWPWELQYGLEMIKSCGDIGIYHFTKQNYFNGIQQFISKNMMNVAEAYLIGIYTNLKLQPMMEIIEKPKPIVTSLGNDYVIITPTRKICYPPMQIMSTRAFRVLGGAQKFIQVKFRDDNMQVMRRDESMMNKIVQNPGLYGIEIAGKRFFDLARSNSMFREHGSYFYQANSQNEIIHVLKSLGNFKAEPSSKTAARVGQYFTSTKEVKRRLETHEIKIIQDYDSLDGKYCFSDGVGIISKKFAEQIQQEFNISFLPSAFQIRCLGFKGVLSIDDRHPYLIDGGGDKLILFRESQKKFDVPSNIEIVLGIVKYSSPAISARKQGLSSTFNKRVNELFTKNLYQITLPLLDSKIFNNVIIEKLPTYVPIQKTLRKIWIDEPFFRSMVIASAFSQLRSLQYYKQINLPSELGRSMLGIVDITGLLNEGQVFVQYTKQIAFRGATDLEEKEKIICKGKVAVSRSPVYNIGDLRILEAVNIPELSHLCNVIVFPNHGTRPHPDEMGGGDLDGDEYSVVWDPELMLYHSEIAADYTPSKKNYDIHTIEELPTNSAKFRVEYMLNDLLATISNCHLAHSDLHGLEHPDVLPMAKNADLAVNYFKSGVPAEKINPEDLCDWYPDFMDKDHLPSYISPRLLGNLHRKCDRFWNLSTNILNEKNHGSKIMLDKSIDFPGFETFLEEASGLYKSYCSEIEHLKSSYGIKTEGELFSNQLGAILGRLRNFDADNSTAHTTTSLIQSHVFEIFRRYRKHYLDSIGETEVEKVINHVIKNVSIKAKQLAVAYYKVAYEDGRCLSFPWIAWEALDVVWATNNGTATTRNNPIYDLVNKKFAIVDSRFDDYQSRLLKRLTPWLENVKLDRKIPDMDLRISLQYFLRVDSHSLSEKQEDQTAINYGQKLIKFFAYVGSFEFAEEHPNYKNIYEAAQETYCRIVFDPFSLNKQNAFKQRKVRGRAFVVAIPKESEGEFQMKKRFLKEASGCAQISYRIRKKTKHHIHFSIMSHGTLQQNETLKDLLTIAPATMESFNFTEVREHKHKLQRLKIFNV